jgi:hypothetical protein
MGFECLDPRDSPVACNSRSYSLGGPRCALCPSGSYCVDKRSPSDCPHRLFPRKLLCWRSSICTEGAQLSRTSSHLAPLAPTLLHATNLGPLVQLARPVRLYSSLVSCDPSYYSSGQQATCTICLVGSHCDLPYIAPTSCPVGYYSTGVAHTYTLCPAGTYAP